MKWETYFESVELVNGKYRVNVSYGKDGVVINNEDTCDNATEVAQKLRDLRKTAKAQLPKGDNDAAF